MQRYNLRLSDQEYEALKKLSAKSERSINELIREAIRQYANVEPDTEGFHPVSRFHPLVKTQGFSAFMMFR